MRKKYGVKTKSASHNITSWHFDLSYIIILSLLQIIFSHVIVLMGK